MIKVGYLAIALSIALAFAMCCTGCQMSMGKITEYQPDGVTIAKVTETTKGASTVQSVTTVFGVRIKTIAPTSTDASPVEIDLGLARNALQITPKGEKSRIKTDWSGIMWWDQNKLDNDLSVGYTALELNTDTEKK